MPAHNIGGGGGRAPGLPANNRYNLAKPFELEGEMTAEKMAQLNEMLAELYQAQQQALNTLLDSDGAAVVTEGGSGTGDVTGPGSSVEGNIAEFDDTSGKVIRDSGVATADVVIGPASATDDRIATFDGGTGKLIQDSGVIISSLLTTTTLALASVNLSEAQLEAMDGTDGTGVVVVAAPGAGKIAIPIMFSIQLNVTDDYGGGNAPAFEINYDGDAAIGLISGLSVTGIVSTPGKYHSYDGIDTNILKTPTFDPANKSIKINRAAVQTGTGAMTGVGKVLYVIIDQM